VASRFFAGYGVGLVSALGKPSRVLLFSQSQETDKIVPLYQSETAPKWIRGTIVGCYQLAITVGLFLAGIVNNGTKNRDDTGSYRIPVGSRLPPANYVLIFRLGRSSIRMVAHSYHHRDHQLRQRCFDLPWSLHG
jgi:hypothetical protein